MGRGKKRRKAKLKKKRMIKIHQGKRVPFSISNCPKLLRGTMYKYEYKVNVHYCSFSNARFNNVRYRSGHITYSSFKNALFEKVDFICVNMKNSKFKGTKFKNCLFFGCDLQDADFFGTSFENVYFISCNLKNIKNFMVNDNIKIIKKYPEILLSQEMKGVLAAMSQNSKLEKYHILTINQKKPNYWMLEILLKKYHEQELKYFFQKLLITNKQQYYTIHNYILALSNYYKR